MLKMIQRLTKITSTSTAAVLVAGFGVGVALTQSAPVLAGVSSTAPGSVVGAEETVHAETASTRTQPDAAVPDTEAGAQPQAKADVLTLEQLRASMEEARTRREVLLKPDPAVAEGTIHKDLIDQWGVEVYGVRLSARGYMIDFRFRVVDLEKALPLFDPRVQPYLLTEGTNIKLPVPVGEKVGAFRTTAARHGERSEGA